MNENNFFLKSYKEKTNNFIENLMKKRESYPYNKLIIIYNNYELMDENNEHYYYNKVKNILNEKQINNIKSFQSEIRSTMDFINRLKNIEKYLYYFFIISKETDYYNLIYYRKLLEGSPIKTKDEKMYKEDLRKIINEYSEKANDIKYLDSYIFYKIYIKFRDSIKDEEECLEKSKKELENLKEIFEDKNIEEKVKNNYINILTTKIKDKNKLIKEIRVLYSILNNSEKSENKIEDLINEIITFQSYSTFKKIMSGLKILLENLNIKDEIYFEMKELNEDLNKNIVKRSVEDINKKIKYLQKFKIDIKQSENQGSKINKFLILLNQNPNAIKWILKQSEDNFTSLYKFIIDSDRNKHLTLKILYLKDIKNYFSQLKGFSSEELIKNIEDTLDKEKEKLIDYLENFYYLENLNNIKEFDEKKNYNLLEDIMNSIFNIEYNVSKKKYELKSIKSIEKDLEIIDCYKEFIDNSFFAITHSIDYNKNNNEYYRNVKNIIDINNDIIIFISILNDKRNIINEQKNFLFKMENKNLVDINNNKSLKNIIHENQINENEEKEVLFQKYCENEIMAFFTGRQLSHLFELIKEGKYDDIKYYIPYYFNNYIINYNPNINNNIEDKNYTFIEQLHIVSDYLSIIFENNEIKLDKFYNLNLIKNNIYESKYIYIKSFFDNEYEHECINIFYSLTGNLPLLSNLLIYNEETLEEEILCFLIRFIKCKTCCLFTLIIQKSRFLNYERNNKINDILKKIQEFIKKKENKSIFLILFSDEIQEFIFQNIKEYRIFKYNNENDDKLIEDIKDKMSEKKISIIYSDKCGAGKSEYIRKNIENKQNYIYFSCGGILSSKSILNKLKEEIKIDERKENVIHFDFSDTNSEIIFKNFLFKFLIFKYFNYKEKIFNLNYYNSKIIIKIELPNTYINYFQKYKILKYIRIEKEINEQSNQNNIPILKEYKSINCIKDSKIQIVSKILNIFNNTEEIKIKNPDLDSKNYIDDNTCNDIICNSLINNIKEMKFKDNAKNYQPNFYQKNIFINFLSSEFVKFIECFHLNPIIFEDKIIPKFFQELRKNIIDSLIKNSIYFTFSPFDSIINDVELYRIEYNKERKNKYDEFIEELQNKMKGSIMDYDKIDPSILAFHDNGILFSIITTNEKDNKLEQINKYFKYLNNKYSKYHKYKINFESRIETPKNLEEKGKLLDEILKIITDNEIVINNIKNIVGEKFSHYAFTRDNYIKMFLLIMRIRAEIPTIIMGETGCGKTHLLEMFSLLYGQNLENMYTLKFHSGISDEDIKLFIQKTIKENNIKEQEQIKKLFKEFENDCKNDEIKKKEELEDEEKKKNEMWFLEWLFFSSKVKEGYKKYKKNDIKKSIENKVKSRKIIIFFDEINTCNSMGLIKQIMCDKKYRKINNIPDRFIIICACNPYRFLKKENQKLQFGLNLRNIKKRKLVYTVNPLPFSLLNFVLDFNDLSPETTNKYIKEMIIKIIGNNENFELMKNLIEKSHFFMKEKSDISLVSLREIDRYGKNYIFFCEYLKKREINLNESQIKKDAIV